MEPVVHTSRLASVVAWARQHSLDQYPFLSACCGIEFMASVGHGSDAARFGVALPKASPRQADLLVVVGTVTERQAPVVQRIYEQMPAPKWVIAFGACASSGGPYQNYAVVPGVDQVVPVDVYVPGCPPGPEQFGWALAQLRAQIAGSPVAQAPVCPTRPFDVDARRVVPRGPAREPR
ncbi:MAG: NADH-quinone oxidoreductase subunit NuoB [Myxococcales bacterium]|nr:NADH-quinone oxidoreductase subunit NuoB [Myxococcales bacterium]